MSELRELNLSSTTLGPESVSHLAEGLPLLSGLQKLDLSGNRLEDRGTCELALVLRGLSNLQVLDLTENNIKGEGTEALSKVLPDMKELETLILELNPLERKAASRLIDTAACAPAFLRLLNLRHCTYDRSYTLGGPLLPPQEVMEALLRAAKNPSLKIRL